MGGRMGEKKPLKFRCIYCQGFFEAHRRPRRCPICKTPFSLTVKPSTKLFKVAMAAQKNGCELDFNLVPLKAAKKSDDVEFALACFPEGENVG